MKQTRKIAQNKEKKEAPMKKIKDVTVNNDNEVMKLFKITIAILVIVAVFFIVTYIVTKKPEKKEETPTEIQYTEILVGELWNKGGSYYVLAGAKDDQYMSLYDFYLNEYQEKNPDANYYLINLDNVFNKKYVSESSNLYTTNPSDIRFKESTLLRISNGKVVNAYEGKDQIVAHLETLIK